MAFRSRKYTFIVGHGFLVLSGEGQLSGLLSFTANFIQIGHLLKAIVTASNKKVHRIKRLWASVKVDLAS